MPAPGDGCGRCCRGRQYVGSIAAASRSQGVGVASELTRSYEIQGKRNCWAAVSHCFIYEESGQSVGVLLLQPALCLTLLCSIGSQEFRLGLMSPVPSHVQARNPAVQKRAP